MKNVGMIYIQVIDTTSVYGKKLKKGYHQVNI